MRLAVAGCTIDWRREFTMPCGVPPETLPAAKRVEYVRGSLVSGDIPLSTHGRYFSKGPNPKHVRRAPKAPAAPRFVVPQASGADTDPPAALPPGAAAVVKGGAFNAAAPDPGTAEQVAAKLEAALPYDALSVRLTPLPIPFLDLDAIRLYFAPQLLPPFEGTLGINEAGVLGDGALPANLPPLLLETRVKAVGGAVLGEVDPALLRSPVRGRFRFEPYLIYQWGAAFKPAGPSNSGRLVIQQPLIPPDPADFTDTQVRKERLFVIDHVDRTSVAEIVHALLMLELKFLKGIVDAFTEVAGADPKLAIPKNLSKAFAWTLSGVNTLMRSWTAFLSALRWRNEDAAVAGAIPADWFAKFPTRDLQAGDRDALVAAVGQLLQHNDWLESLTFYSKQVHARRLAGFSWLEILVANGQDPNTQRFPVPSNQPPFTPRDNGKIAQHKRLRLLDDPDFRWIGCYAGCPLGKPATLYAPQGGPPSVHFPAGGLTTYEVEALHAAGTAGTELGIAAPAATGPQPGKAMDLSGYSAVALGKACTFAAERSGSDSLHTTIDWINELTRGIHFHLDEAPFLDLEPLMDPTSAASHPVMEAVRFDDHLKARSLRRQMDAVEATGATAAWLAWWEPKLDRAPVGGVWGDGARAGPTNSFQRGATAGSVNPGIFEFDDLVLGPQSGFDVFDIESAYLACARMAEPIASANQLPLAVLLALMEREGIKQFGPINRGVRNTTNEAVTVRWESRRRVFDDPANPGASGLDPFDGTVPPTDPPVRSRRSWTLFPYGLDHFAKPAGAAAFDAVFDAIHQADGVMTLEAGESVSAYLHDRVHSSFFLLPALGFANVGTPRIWKRTRRAHWAFISLMAGFFRQLEVQIQSTPIGAEFLRDTPAGWTPQTGPNGWFPPGKSPPDLTGKTPLDPEWKDYISYYATIYVAYNGGERVWGARARQVELAAAGPLSLRDQMLFRHDRGSQIMAHAGRFAIGVDAYLRLDYMTQKSPGAYAAAAADTTDPAGRSPGWGV